jgi:hypothetical protein
MPSYGQNTDIDASAEPLAAAEALVKTGVRIKALAANATGIVYVGNDASVTASNGYPLGSGEECSFDVGWFQSAPGAFGDLQDIYVIGSTTNLGVAYWYV